LEEIMSVNLSIKGVPDELAERLRQRAARHHRSLQGELMALLEAGVNEPTPLAPHAMPTLLMRRGTKTIEQTAAELRARFPEPIRGGPLAVDIIRADRDSR
jgi:plasmid stability protein